tara:strand:+ start:2719 stop:3264 length:546 start_codon:yes stop_codon:yes gene_type:complete
MKKCLIVVDFFRGSIDHLNNLKNEIFKPYTKDRIANLITLLKFVELKDDFDIFYTDQDNAQEFWFDKTHYNIKKWDNSKYDIYYLVGLSLTECVYSIYESVNSKNKYIVWDCCIQEVFDGDVNYDHADVNTVEELVSFERDFLGGKRRFRFYDNSPGNDGRGEWLFGDFPKCNFCKLEDLI